MRTIQNIVTELDELQVIRDRLKECAMVYDRQFKEHVALANNLPIGAYYDLPFREWMGVKREYLDAR